MNIASRVVALFLGPAPARATTNRLIMTSVGCSLMFYSTTAKHWQLWRITLTPSSDDPFCGDQNVCIMHEQ